VDRVSCFSSRRDDDSIEVLFMVPPWADVTCAMSSNRTLLNTPRRELNKKKPARRTPEGFCRAGLLVNEPPGPAGLPFV
jgi:hypothetical protein